MKLILVYKSFKIISTCVPPYLHKNHSIEKRVVEVLVKSRRKIIYIITVMLLMLVLACMQET
jgi:hypothetical protein